MFHKNRLYYEARVLANAATWLPLLLVPGYALLVRFDWISGRAQPKLLDLVSGFELLLPLAAALSAAHWMSLERDTGFDELRCSYPERSLTLPLLRTLGACGLALLSAILGTLILGCNVVQIAEIVLSALPPTFFLIGLALFLNNLSGNHWVALVGIVSYWLINFVAGQRLGLVHLFPHSLPPDTALSYALNRWLLTSLALLWLLLNMGLSRWRRPRGG